MYLWWKTKESLPGELCRWGWSRPSQHLSLDVISSHDSSGIDPHEKQVILELILPWNLSVWLKIRHPEFGKLTANFSEWLTA